jgi:hypothetical protein
MNDKERQLQTVLERCFWEIKDTQNTIPLRFAGKEQIDVNDVEKTYYCEKRHDYKYRMTEVQETLTPHAKEILEANIVAASLQEEDGRAGHGASAYYSGHIEEQPVGAIFNGIKLIGRPDCICAEGSSITILERKYRMIQSLPKYDTPYREAIAQAGTYAYCVDYMVQKEGFPANVIGYDIQYYPLDCSWCNNPFTDACNVCELKKHWKQYHFNYDNQRKEWLIEKLNFVVAYFVGKREAIPTKFPSKGKSCEYRNICNLCGWRA